MSPQWALRSDELHRLFGRKSLALHGHRRQRRVCAWIDYQVCCLWWDLKQFSLVHVDRRGPGVEKASVDLSFLSTARSIIRASKRAGSTKGLLQSAAHVFGPESLCVQCDFIQMGSASINWAVSPRTQHSWQPCHKRIAIFVRVVRPLNALQLLIDLYWQAETQSLHERA